MPVIELTTIIKAPVAICFDLARSIDLHRLSMEGTHEEAIAGTTSGLIGMDQEVTWRARHFGITQSLTSKITGFRYPSYFRDEMTRGTFKKIKHEHWFGVSGQATIMRETFEFESPGGVIGKIFNRLILERYLTGLLRKRNKLIKTVAEGEQWKTLLNI